MKRSCLILTVFVVSCLLFQAGCQKQTTVVEEPETGLVESKLVVGEQQPEQAEPEPNQPGPKIAFKKVVHDFGELGPGTQKDCEFEFANTGEGTLKDIRVHACCGVKAELKDNKREYGPGESGAVAVTYTARGLPGGLAKSLRVTSNDKTNPNVTLTLKAKIVLQVRNTPEKLSLLLNAENAGCQDITLTSADDQPFAIKSFWSTADCITVEFDSSVQNTEFVLAPKVDIEKLKNTSDGYIRIGLTHPQCNMVVIPFSVLSRFVADPRSILIREAEPEKPIRKDVWVLNNYGEDFEIESTSSRKGIVKVLSQEKVGNRCKLQVEIMPPSPRGKTYFIDVFNIDIKGGDKLSVNCRGFYSKK